VYTLVRGSGPCPEFLSGNALKNRKKIEKKNVPSSEVVDDVMRSSAAICASISWTLAPKVFAVLHRV
jgi:hypothetical protein